MRRNFPESGELEKFLCVVTENCMMMFFWNCIMNKVAIDVHPAQWPVAAIQEAVGALRVTDGETHFLLKFIQYAVFRIGCKLWSNQ